MSEPEQNPHIAENNARNLPRFTSFSEVERWQLNDDLKVLTERMSKTVACLHEWYSLVKLADLNVRSEFSDMLQPLTNRTEEILREWKSL